MATPENMPNQEQLAKAESETKTPENLRPAEKTVEEQMAETGGKRAETEQKLAKLQSKDLSDLDPDTQALFESRIKQLEDEMASLNSELARLTELSQAPVEAQPEATAEKGESARNKLERVVADMEAKVDNLSLAPQWRTHVRTTLKRVIDQLITDYEEQDPEFQDKGLLENPGQSISKRFDYNKDYVVSGPFIAELTSKVRKSDSERRTLAKKIEDLSTEMPAYEGTERGKQLREEMVGAQERFVAVDNQHTDAASKLDTLKTNLKEESEYDEDSRKIKAQMEQLMDEVKNDAIQSMTNK